jgi:S1-C subfamily serine protease
MYRSALLFVLLSAPVAAAAPDGVVLIESKSETEYSAGSGTVIAYENGKSLILSVAHVVDDPKAKLTVTHKGKAHKATYLWASPTIELTLPDGKKVPIIDGPDLALLTVDAELPVMKLAATPAKVGDEVKTFGFAGGPKFADKGPYPKIGKVVDAEGVWASPDARRGDSGSGLLNSKDELVGVVHSRSADADEPGLLAVPLNEVKKFLLEKAEGFPKLKESLKPKK